VAGKAEVGGVAGVNRGAVIDHCTVSGTIAG
jgi:hypothetical protein